MSVHPVRRAATISIVLAWMAWGPAAHGAGFALIEQSGSGQGNAFAGGAAIADDPSTLFFNPAGMTRLTGNQMNAAGHVVVPSAEYSDRGSTQNAAFGGAALPGTTTKDPGVVGLVPNFYYVHDLGPRIRAGVGVNAPFGLKTIYDRGWVGRYHAISSALKTVNLNPSLAIRVTDGLSLGAGINVQYASARLTNAIDQSAACLGLGIPLAVCNANGLATGGAVATAATDGFIELDADGYGYGFNAGLLYEFNPSTRVGFHYRSKISHKLKGLANFESTEEMVGALAAVGAAPGPFTDQRASAKTALPETFSLSAYHDVDDRWAVMADVTYTRWSRFEYLIIQFEGGHSQNTTYEGWNNTWRAAIGATYRHSDALTFRAGAAYDQTPVPNSQLRTPRIPGDSRTWLSFGVSYRPSENLSVDVAYSHLFVGDVSINNVEVNTGHVLVGEYEADVNILAVQAVYSF